MAHRVLDVVAEDPEEPHVPDEVHPAAVQEHRGDAACATDAAVASVQAVPGPIGTARARRERAEERRPGIEAERGRRSDDERGLRAEALEQDPREDVERRSARRWRPGWEVRVVVPDWKHRLIVNKCRATGSQSLCRALEGRKAATRLTGNDCEPVARHFWPALTTRAWRP